MGFFSWKTSDTDKSISNRYSERGALPCYLLIPKEFGGGHIYEDKYGGYGVFGGRDVYALVAQWNAPDRCKDKNGDWLSDDDCRDVGIELACYDDDNAALKYPIKLTEEAMAYEEAEPSMSCPEQGYFYCDEEDEEEDDYY